MEGRRSAEGPVPSTAMSVQIEPCPQTSPGTIAARVRWNDQTRTITFRTDFGPLSERVDPFYAAALLPAMKIGQPLHACPDLSPRLRESAPAIQEVFLRFCADLKPVATVAPERAPGPRPADDRRGVGCFFSGGVDAFYSVLDHADEITHLIFVHGFDIRLDRTDLRRRVSASLRAAAAELGKPLIEVETDLRALGDPLLDWGRQYHGAALAAVALALAPHLRRCYIPSSQLVGDPPTWASNPISDPLWSTEDVEIVHDADIPRVDKVARLVESETAMRYLRVCWENRRGAYNCGTCAKCLRTMTSLRALGALERCATFDRPLSLRRAAFVPMDDSNRFYAEENLRLIARCGGDPPLEKAVRDSLNERYYRGAWRAGRHVWWKVKSRLRR